MRRPVSGTGESLPHPRLRRRLELYSSRIPDSVTKLRFIKRTLQGFEARPESIRRLPILRGIVFHYVALESLGALIWSPRTAETLQPRGPLWLLYRLRHVALVLAILAVGVTSYYAGGYGYGIAQTGADWLFGKIIPPPSAAAMSVADYPRQRLSERPNNVWLVDVDGEEELWSNGLRVRTEFETEGSPRSFFAFPRDGSPPVPMGPTPVGIVYHASQSDMAPLAPEFSRDILSTTRDLLGWLSRREIYNYVIDRFGQVYRIVADQSEAVHAGVSIWADERHHYLNLNEGFIGVAFESQWSAGTEVITPAQLQSALNLTDVLRARYDIEGVNCVPHGLVSVNATKRLIGYHADWARNFPFAALGLPDLYRVPPPSMTAYGFRYDADLVERLGGALWPGVEAAEAALRSRADDEDTTVQALRARLFHRYSENLALVKASSRAASAGGSP